MCDPLLALLHRLCSSRTHHVKVAGMGFEPGMSQYIPNDGHLGTIKPHE